MHIGSGKQALAVHRWGGNGPEALFIHGIGSSSASWNPVLPALQSSLSPITMDLHGHGDSGKPASGYLYQDYIADVERVLHALKLDNPIIIGHSLGGIVALWWAAQNPATARAVVAVDSPLRSGEAFRPAFDGWIAQNAMTPEALAAAYLDANPEWGEQRAIDRARIMTSTPAGVFTELKAESMANEGIDRIAELEGITSPVLLLHGDLALGSMVHPDDLQALPRRLPNATVVHIPESGHRIHREQPGAFVHALTGFLSALPAAD